MIDWNEITKAVDRATKDAIGKYANGKSADNSLPKALVDKINSWQFGAYGWTSPVNLMITACWTKWLMPKQDVCKIWAKDAANHPIQDSYSIRSYDERITVPLVSKVGIYHHFCSNNSGMQGSRALEKTRSAARLDRDTQLEQRVLFDLPLFAEIMNDINALNPDQALAAFQHFVQIGLGIADKRKKTLLELHEIKDVSNKNSQTIILRALGEIKDPQFVKAAAASLLMILAKYSPLLSSVSIKGVEGKKTGANARSHDPGDLWLELKEVPVLGCEVKDSSKTFGHEILSAVEDRFAKNPTLKHYLLLTAADIAVEADVLESNEWRLKIDLLVRSGLRVQALTFADLFLFLSLFTPPDEKFLLLVNDYLAASPDLKPDTVRCWTKLIK